MTAEHAPPGPPASGGDNFLNRLSEAAAELLGASKKRMAKAKRKPKSDPPADPPATSPAPRTHRLPRVGDPLRYVFAERARCPNPECRGTGFRTYHSQRHPNGAIERHSECRACGCRFILVLE